MMQGALSLAITAHAFGDITPGQPLDVPLIETLAIDPQNAEGDLPVTLEVSRHCTVIYVLTQSAVQPAVAQIAAGTDHSHVQAPASGSILTSDTATYNPPLTLQVESGTYHLHAYPTDGNGDGNIVSFGPVVITDAPAD